MSAPTPNPWTDVPPDELGLYDELMRCRAVTDGRLGRPANEARTLINNLIASHCPRANRAAALDAQAGLLPRGASTSGRD